MDESAETTRLETDLAMNEPDAIAFAEFLERVPPSQTRKIVALAIKKHTSTATGSRIPYYEVLTPDILLHCQHSSCHGTRFFRFIEDSRPTIRTDNFRYFFMSYRCSNCLKTTKVFSLMAKVNKDEVTDLDDEESYHGVCYKIGELPVYGPPIPSRLISLIGPDRETFLKGRRCENLGLGIGAFVYYRRVVEGQRLRILDEIIKVCKKIGGPPGLIETLENAKAENQFKKSVESVRGALPQILMINGQNPLTLSHGALSEGLHARTDEHCLVLAHAVRVVLTELSERLGQALKDEAELRSAISLLAKRSDDAMQQH